MDNKLYKVCLEKFLGINSITWDELAKRNHVPSGETLRNQFKRIRKNKKVESVKDAYAELKLVTPAETPILPKENSNLDLDNLEDSEDLDYKETTEVHQDGSVTSDRLIYIFEQDTKSPEALLKAHGFDPSLWVLTHAKSNMWHMQKKGGVRLLCYQSKITCSPKAKDTFSSEMVDKLFNSLKVKDLSPIKLKPLQYSKDGNCLVIPFSDFHLGMLATKDTTGNVYDMEVAEQRYFDTLGQLKERIVGKKFKEIVFIVGNDFLNSDNLAGTTTALTPQDNSAFWYEIYDKALELLIKGINALSEVSKVKVINVISNHDMHSMYGIMKAIDYYYKDNPNVTIDTSQLPRKYFRFGKVLFGLSHDLVIKDALSLMTTECKKDWSECVRYYWLLGHLHREMIYQNVGEVAIMRLPTMSGFSRWSAGKGYVQADRRNQVFIIDGENGILDTMNIFVD